MQEASDAHTVCSFAMCIASLLHYYTCKKALLFIGSTAPTLCTTPESNPLQKPYLFLCVFFDTLTAA